MSDDEYLDDEFYQEDKNYEFGEEDSEEIVDIMNETKEDIEDDKNDDDHTLSQIDKIMSASTLLRSSEKYSPSDQRSDSKDEKPSSDSKGDYNDYDTKDSKEADAVDNYANFFSNTSTPTSSKPTTPVKPSSASSASANASSQELRDQVETLTSELNKYKKKCTNLEEKLDVAMALGGANAVFLRSEVKDAIRKICDKNKIVHEICDKKKITETDLLSFLKIFQDSKTLKKMNSSPSLNSTGPISNKVSDKLAYLEEQLREASSSVDSTNQMKAKFLSLNEKLRVEKDTKRNLELELASTKKKVEMLSDHIEKLITHLKRDASNKLKLHESINQLEKVNKQNADKIALVMKKSLAKDRLILELREGSKILEDQLRLMDEKYIELRGKLDWARSISGKKLKKAEKIASELRVKFALSTNNSHALLDNIPMNDSTLSPSSSLYQSGGMDDHYSWKNNTKFSTSNSSINSSKSIITRPEPSIDVVMEKIKQQQGIRDNWTEEKVKKLAGVTR